MDDSFSAHSGRSTRSCSTHSVPIPAIPAPNPTEDITDPEALPMPTTNPELQSPVVPEIALIHLHNLQWTPEISPFPLESHFFIFSYWTLLSRQFPGHSSSAGSHLAFWLLCLRWFHPAPRLQLGLPSSQLCLGLWALPWQLIPSAPTIATWVLQSCGSTGILHPTGVT